MSDLRLCFDKQFMIDLGVTLRVHHDVVKKNRCYDNAGTAGSGEKCFICPDTVALKKMRLHVAKHIALRDVAGHSICGFCGRDACDNHLKATSRNKTVHYKVVTNCCYEMKWGKDPKFTSKSPCSNRLIKCPSCKADIWVYNASLHYQAVHPNVECPAFVSQQEWDAIKVFKV